MDDRNDKAVNDRGGGDAGGGGRDGAVRRKRSPDPMGKRALFWVPGTGEGTAPDGAGPPTRLPLGKEALFSGAPAGSKVAADTSGNPLSGRGSFTVECSKCRAVTRIGLVDLVIYQLPFGAWCPGRRFDRHMTCPACRRRVWASVTLRRD
jgi:hypothetical protein